MTRLGFRCLVLLTTGVATLQLQAVDCSQFQIAANRAHALVEADTTGINQLSAGFKLNASALTDWANMTADQKSKLYQTAVLNLIQAAAAAPFVDVAAGNVSLPNGIASIGPGQAGALINLLRSNGIDNPALFTLISGAAAVSGKPAAAKNGLAILDSLIPLLQTGIATHGGDAVGAAASVAQLGLSLMGPAYAGYATALGGGTDILTLVQSEVMASKAGDQIRQLTKVTDANLLELKRRISKLKGDVQGLQKAKDQLDSCSNKTKLSQAPPLSFGEQNPLFKVTETTIKSFQWNYEVGDDSPLEIPIPVNQQVSPLSKDANGVYYLPNIASHCNTFKRIGTTGLSLTCSRMETDSKSRWEYTASLEVSAGGLTGKAVVKGYWLSTGNHYKLAESIIEGVRIPYADGSW